MPTVKQHLAAIRGALVLAVNPAASVRGPKHVVTKGATPVLTPAETRALLDRIDTGTLVGLRDRALLSVLVYSFARVSAAVGMRRQDYFRQGLRGWLRLHEKGGKRHDVPAHHRAEEAVEAYLAAGGLEPVLKRGRRAVNFRLIAEQWDRIGQFYAAFPAGHATASAALQRLNRFQASNRFYAANRELGRALKTEFVLQYMSEPQLRAKVRRGLLKVEQLHALARAVYYGQRGRISAREVYDQMNACSCLTLILACIVYWQAREISGMAAAPDFPFDPELLRHVSPIEWKNVILYGEIKIDPAKFKIRGS